MKHERSTGVTPGHIHNDIFSLWCRGQSPGPWASQVHAQPPSDTPAWLQFFRVIHSGQCSDCVGLCHQHSTCSQQGQVKSSRSHCWRSPESDRARPFRISASVLTESVRQLLPQPGPCHSHLCDAGDGARRSHVLGKCHSRPCPRRLVTSPGPDGFPVPGPS